MNLFWVQFRRDFKAATRTRDEMITPLVFFLIVVALFPLSISPDPAQLAVIAPGTIWVLAILAALLSLDGMFRRDFEDGSLEQLLLNADPLFMAVLGKIAAQWCVTGLLLTLFSPVAALLLALPADGLEVLILSLLLGTPTVSCIGALGAALTVGLRKGGMLVALLVLPLYIPILVFGTSATVFATLGLDTQSALLWLAALAALSITLMPFAVAVALKISLQR